VPRLLPALLLLLAPAAFAAPVPKSLKRPTDEQALVGRWQGTEGPGKTHVHTFRFAADSTCGSTDPKGDEVPASYTAHPGGGKQITWLEGPERVALRCVYEVDGDALKIGFVRSNKKAPADLKFEDCSHVFTLTRVKDGR
jgi:hypothetical protein